MATSHALPGVLAALIGVFACSYNTELRAADNDSSFYVGVGGGESRHVLPASYYNSDLISVPPQDLRQSDTAYTIYGGYRANPYLAVEVGLTDVGSSEQWYAACINGWVCDFSVNSSPFETRRETRRADFALVLIRPLWERFEVFAKLGVSRSRHHSTILTPDRLVRGGRSYTTERLLSAGASYVFHSRWALRLQWDRSTAPFTTPSGKHPEDIRTWSLAIEHRFDLWD